MKKRLLAILLTLAMMVGLLPVATFAVSGEVQTATIGNMNFTVQWAEKKNQASGYKHDLNVSVYLDNQPVGNHKFNGYVSGIGSVLGHAQIGWTLTDGFNYRVAKVTTDKIRLDGSTKTQSNGTAVLNEKDNIYYLSYSTGTTGDIKIYLTTRGSKQAQKDAEGDNVISAVTKSGSNNVFVYKVFEDRTDVNFEYRVPMIGTSETRKAARAAAELNLYKMPQNGSKNDAQWLGTAYALNMNNTYDTDDADMSITYGSDQYWFMVESKDVGGSWTVDNTAKGADNAMRFGSNAPISANKDALPEYNIYAFPLAIDLTPAGSGNYDLCTVKQKNVATDPNNDPNDPYWPKTQSTKGTKDHGIQARWVEVYLDDILVEKSAVKGNASEIYFPERDDGIKTTDIVVTPKDTTKYAYKGVSIVYGQNNDPDVYRIDFTSLTGNEYRITYNANGGNQNTAPADDVYTIGGQYSLSNTKPTHDPINNVNVVFLGWTDTQDTQVYTKDDLDPTGTTVTSVNLTNIGTKTVYALWGLDTNGNGTADCKETTYNLYYNANGGNSGIGQVPNDTDVYVTDNTVTLATTPVPTHAQDGGKDVVFLGWSENQFGVLTAANWNTFDKDKDIVTDVTFGSSDITVYAVWGVDSNGDGTPDVYDRYRLIYDANTTDAVQNLPVDTGYYQSGVQATLTTNPAPVWKNGVVFVGWTETQVANVLTKNDTAPQTVTGVTFDDDNITVYAAWGEDTNNNGIADVTEPQYTLTYDANGASKIDKGLPKDKTGNLTKDTVKLNMTKTVSGIYNGQNVYFVGWSADPQPVMSKGDTYQDKLITQVTFKKKDIKVYAVWGYDTNGNQIADVTETTYTLTYKANGGSGAPKDNNQYLEKEIATLDTVNVPIRAADHGKNVVFAGWTEKKQKTIFEAGDTAPTYLTQVTFADKDINVFAAWGYDINKNGIADVNETQYTLRYDPNGGSRAPADEKHLPKEAVTLSSKTPVHQDAGDISVLFVGWSETKVADILSAGDQKPDLVTDITMPDANDKTVYAVWSYDTNKNGVADIDETGKMLTYDANGGTGAPTDTNKYAPGTEVTLSKTVPTHGQDDGKDVVFIGWTTDKNSQIFKVTDTAPNTVEKVTFQSKPITVYAAWGYDTNGNGKADVTETKYDLNYIHNGGIVGTMPDNLPDQFVSKNQATLSSVKPLHLDENGVPVYFIGWSLEYLPILSAGDSYKDKLVTGVEFTDHDISVFAVWGYDTNGDKIPDATQEAHKLNFDLSGGYKGPESGKYYLTGTVIDLTAVKQPTHDDVKEVPVVFIGWSETAPSGIYTKDDSTPSTVKEITMGNADITLYAVWGYDTNNNGKADVLEVGHYLKYFGNGASGNVPADNNLHMPGDVVKVKTKVPTHADDADGNAILFLGWSEDKVAVIDRNGTVPTLVGK
ncbi:MAG: InlB B-repeat-containing protein, partial [Ruminiclostridium sp.]|nr:InlB B-repeat-containing protein [Ruminiclostridium sp.]